MNGFDLFAALSDVDEKFLAQQQPKTRRAVLTDTELTAEAAAEPAEDTASPRKDRGWSMLGTVAAACLCIGILAGVLLHWVFTRPNDWGTEGSTAWTYGCCVTDVGYEEPEPTSGADLPQASFVLRLRDMAEYHALVAALNLSDEKLTAFLAENGYADVDLTTREQLESVRSIMNGVPIPGFGQAQPESIFIAEHSSVVIFEFSDAVLQVQKTSSALTVESKTRQLGRIAQYTKYPLYLGNIAEAGGTVTGHYVLNVDDHAVELQVEAGSREETLSMLEELWFHYLNNTPKHGVYFKTGENLDNEMVPMLYINTQTGVFVASGGIAMSYSEIGQYVLENGKLTVTTQSATFVFAVLDSETLLLLDDGDFGSWMNKGDRYKWTSDFGG